MPIPTFQFTEKAVNTIWLKLEIYPEVRYEMYVFDTFTAAQIDVQHF